MTLSCLADVTLSGHVRSYYTQDAVPDAEVRVTGTGICVITNEDGYFVLKVAEMPQRLTVSALGHRNKVVSTLEENCADLDLWLLPETRLLNQVTVYTPADLVRMAIDKIPENYGRTSERLSCFYRETTRKQSRYVNLSEAVMSLYKTDYNHGIFRDQVQVEKGRSLISQRAKDTLSIKVIGGPHEAVQLDLVKNREILLYEEDIAAYRFTMEEGTSIDERAQYVISFEPERERPYALYRGKLYIDMELLAFTRMEISLDMKDTQKATSVMLYKKPFGLRFRPRELSTIISYHYDGTCFRLSYLRNLYYFSCDWKKRWFSTAYRVVSEMVVTDYQEAEVPRSRKGAFGSHDMLDTQTEAFNDAAFWESYNILEPSESLEHAVKRLKRRAE